jgi:transcriptional regulator with XRE-family HTH domain
MRERSGLSLREVSRRSEINPGRLSILERGVEPTADEMDKIATVLRDAALLTEMER